MAIKTAAEMFGDGGGGNPQVPIDTGNPPGFNVLNRGVAFGEQVTSSIKNRTPYSLVLNDEDLNSRLAIYEVGGLDAAYDLGLTATPGGGRTIVKDAGALETVSALATQYLDDIANAHYRANMFGDTVTGGVGFDSVGALLDTMGSVGFLDRKPVLLNGATIIGVSTGTLNPGGGGATQVRLDGGDRWKFGADTNIALGYDLVEIAGAGALSGLYNVSTFVSDTIATVSQLNLNAPAFTADTVVTVTLYRRRFASTFLGHGGAFFGGMPGALGTVFSPNKVNALDTAGADNAWFALYRPADGVPVGGSYADYKGTLGYTLSSADIDATGIGAYATAVELGLFSNRLLNPPASEVEASHVVLDQAGSSPASRLDFASLVYDSTTTLTFVASTPTDGDLNDGNAALEELASAGGLLAFITGYGWFRVVGARRGGVANRIVVRDLDGTLPASLPTSGTAAVTVYTYQALGKQPQYSVYDLEGGVILPNPTVTPHGVFSAGGEADAAALVLHCDDSGVEQCLIRGFAGEGFGGGLPQERFRVTRNGHLMSGGNIYGANFQATSSGGYNYNPAQSNTILIPLSNGIVDVSGGGNYWFWDGSRWASRQDLDGGMYFDFRIPHGAVLTEVQMHLSVGNNDTTRLRWSLDHSRVVWLSGSAPAITSQFSLIEAGSAGIQTLTQNAFSAPTFDGATDVFRLKIRSGDDAGAHLPDLIYSLNATIDDPGPRNH